MERTRTRSEIVVILTTFLLSTYWLPPAFSFSSRSASSHHRLPRSIHSKKPCIISTRPSRAKLPGVPSITTTLPARHEPDTDADAATDLSRQTTINEMENNTGEQVKDSSRRLAIQGLLFAAVSLPAAPALAGKPELDKASGQLYTPKAEMLSGGSAAARGITVESMASGSRLKPGQALQTVYETRFLAYLSRFLLNYDPAANAWWANNGLGDTWDITKSQTAAEREQIESTFAEFAESVEFGLADYFVGPYGSYSSLQAAKAGIGASAPAQSTRANNEPQGFLNRIFAVGKKKQSVAKDMDSISKQGILNLYTLLKARYTSVSAKRQLAILFSFISVPKLQPTAEIRSLLGEADNATITKIDVVKPFSRFETNSRTSSQRGGGYSVTEFPTITIAPPPALGDAYKTAMGTPIMEQTSRVLRIQVLDGGEGYEVPPEVYVGLASNRQCSACAILDRQGRVESVVVLDPGYGYGRNGRKGQPPKVTIAPPPKKRKGEAKQVVTTRRAQAIAELEYEIVGIAITQGGNGFPATEPPKVTVSPPKEDPDWFVDIPELAVLVTEFGPVRAEVSQMQFSNGNLAYSMGCVRPPTNLSTYRLQSDPLELLSSSVRPELDITGHYTIPAISAVPTYPSSPSPKYRAVDPLFGPIGSVPVSKGANELRPGEYARLALSGAVCTVLVRTALNPLELIKTKLQLQNDEELLTFARENMKKNKPPPDHVTSSETLPEVKESKKEEKVGTGDLITSFVKLRGPLALFQSADITLLASLVFGSFGFGATEFYRRTFTVAFSNETGGEYGSVLIVLLAAALATVITSLAAAPFELLRVRSMGLLEPKKWTEVMVDFIEEKAAKDGRQTSTAPAPGTEFSFKDLKPKDLLPLWAGFPPTVSRELLFAIPKFLAFDVISKGLIGFINSEAGAGALPIQVGVGTEGLLISAISGAVAGLAGATVSHPADLILTYTSAAKKSGAEGEDDDKAPDWKEVVKELLSREGGPANLYIGLQPRLTFFFLVVGLQFFLYDYVKNLLNVGSDDLSLVLDVFYAIRQGLEDSSQ